MRKLACSLTLLALALTAVGGFAATKQIVQLKPSIKGTRSNTILKAQREPSSMAQFKAQNHLSYAVNSKILNAAKLVKTGSFVNGTIDTVPYFSSWFITGSRNSVYPYSMVGH